MRRMPEATPKATPESTGKLEPSKSFLTFMNANRTGIWTTIGGGVLIFVVWQLALVAIILVSPLVRGIIMSEGAADPAAQDEALAIVIFLLAGFGPAFIIMLLWRALMEQRRVATLFTARPRFRWRLVIASALVVALLGLILTLIFDPSGGAQIETRGAKFSAEDWLILILAYGIGISVQATFEEVYVRGWLLQHVSRFIPSAAGAIFVTAMVFSALHAGHPGWATYAVAFAMGLAYGWSAWRLGGLEAAIGAHIANNLVGALLSGQMVSGNPPTMDGPQLALYALYVLGFLLFVEVWARFLENPSRA
jgi:uncharacterized protein